MPDMLTFMGKPLHTSMFLPVTLTSDDLLMMAGGLTCADEEIELTDFLLCLIHLIPEGKNEIEVYLSEDNARNIMTHCHHMGPDVSSGIRVKMMPLIAKYRRFLSVSSLHMRPSIELGGAISQENKTRDVCEKCGFIPITPFQAIKDAHGYCIKCAFNARVEQVKAADNV